MEDWEYVFRERRSGGDGDMSRALAERTNGLPNVGQRMRVVEDVLLALVRYDVEFIVVGGVSAILQGVPLALADVDVCYRKVEDNSRRLASALIEFSPILLSASVTHFSLRVRELRADFLVTQDVLGRYEDIDGASARARVAGIEVKVLSLEQLIVVKRALGRAKDHAALAELLPRLER